MPVSFQKLGGARGTAQPVLHSSGIAVSPATLGGQRPSPRGPREGQPGSLCWTHPPGREREVTLHLSTHL